MANKMSNDSNLINFNLPGSSKIFRPVFTPLQNNSRKRKVDELLEDLTKHKEKEADKRYELEETDEEEEEDFDMEQLPPKIRDAIYDLDFPIDSVFKKALKFHQVEGLQFMWDRVYEKRSGCLLAHSMGLGKTLQVISLLTTMYQHLKRKPETKFPTGKRVLILAPLVTLANWVSEFGKWAVSDAENVIGELYNIAELPQGRDVRMKFLKYWYTHGGVMLINYDQFRSFLSNKHINDQQEYCRYLVNPGADVVILDEAHRIKNSSTLLSNHVTKIRTKARICLTGYPLQNYLLEYYYMVDFITPGILGKPASFKSYFGLDIEKCYADSSKHAKQEAAYKLYVLQLLCAYMTHRRDDTVLKMDLPTKTEYMVKFRMSAVQHEAYTASIQAGSIGAPLVGLLALRSICNHPKIFHSLLTNRRNRKRNEALNMIRQDTKDPDFIDDSEFELEEGSVSVVEETLDTETIEDNELALFERWDSIGFDWADDYFEQADIESWKCSGKMSFIVDLVRECQVVNEKLVIVSHSLSCLDYVEHLLPVFGIKSVRLDGSVKVVERQVVLNQFDQDRSIGVILLSAKAAAIGINITAASRIVLVDQDWNPLYDEQSIGRVYRYGQTKPVFVYRLVTTSTIEERIYMQSFHKRTISRRVIDNKTTKIISREELTEYFQEPEEELAAINIDDFPDKESLDYISSSVLKQNKDNITHFEELRDEVDLEQAEVSTLSAKIRQRAKNTAMSLVRDWQRGEPLFE